MQKNSYTKNIQKKCDICGHIVFVDQYNNGQCENCGWEQGGDSIYFPSIVRYPNFIPLNKAIKLYKENKPLEPDFEDFIGMYNFYGEVEFTYKGTRYGVAFHDESRCISLFNIENNQFKLYKTTADFYTSATIDGKLLKDIWSEVKNVDWLQ